MFGPAWTRGEIEQPLGQESRGTWQAAVYTDEQQARLGVDKLGAKNVRLPTATAKATTTTTTTTKYPADWGQPPAMQTKDYRPLPGGHGMGSGTLAEWIQQNLDASTAPTLACEGSNAVPFSFSATAPSHARTAQVPKVGRMCGGYKAIGPAWTHGKIEQPLGQESRGTWQAAVYTDEQQARLGVDKLGAKSNGTATATATTAAPTYPTHATATATATTAAPTYPTHWGQPPMIQTMDHRPLPGGYGMGSGTLAHWIQQRLLLDADAAKDAEDAKDANDKAAGEAKATGKNTRFPVHWGQPPQRQTRDLRHLPGGFGKGSGTLARWIQEKLDGDAVAGTAVCHTNTLALSQNLVCPHSMNGEHCYTSRAMVFACTQCGAKKK